MARVQDLPALASEFVQMARAYMVQETLDPAKKLGRYAGISLGAAAAWMAAVILLSVAGVRTLVRALPEGPYWEALGYLIFVVVLVAFAALLIRLGPSQREEGTRAR